MSKFVTVMLAAVIFSAIVDVRTASSHGPTTLAHLHAGNTDRPPIGWVQFCSENRAECVAPSNPGKPVAITRALWEQLDTVNRFFNQKIEAVTDIDQYGVIERWTFADTGKGDCEDYVLEKRRMLLRMGWSPASLLITVVLDKQKSGHAVLTVVSDRGDYVLDNMTDEILTWSRSGLTFVKRQSPQDPNVWVDLGRILGTPEVVTAATRK